MNADDFLSAAIRARYLEAIRDRYLNNETTKGDVGLLLAWIDALIAKPRNPPVDKSWLEVES